MARKLAEISSQKACGSLPAVARGLLDLLAVLVGAGQELHVIAVEALEAGQHVASKSPS